MRNGWLQIKINTAGFELDNIATDGYSQMSHKPTHFINESSPCIDLIFYFKYQFCKKNCGNELSIYEKCHHNIIYEILSFNVPFPNPYYREIWNRKYANTESIRKTISMLDWSKASLDRIANEKCQILSNDLLNVF